MFMDISNIILKQYICTACLINGVIGSRLKKIIQHNLKEVKNFYKSFKNATYVRVFPKVNFIIYVNKQKK